MIHVEIVWQLSIAFPSFPTVRRTRQTVKLEKRIGIYQFLKFSETAQINGFDILYKIQCLK
jgi:hypothetical protein